MVFISKQAKVDIDNIFIGLLSWEKIELTLAEAMQYIDDIVDTCYTFDNLNYHTKAKSTTI